MNSEFGVFISWHKCQRIYSIPDWYCNADTRHKKKLNGGNKFISLLLSVWYANLLSTKLNALAAVLLRWWQNEIMVFHPKIQEGTLVGWGLNQMNGKFSLIIYEFDERNFIFSITLCLVCGSFIGPFFCVKTLIEFPRHIYDTFGSILIRENKYWLQMKWLFWQCFMFVQVLILYFLNHFQTLALQHDPGTSDDSGRASERLTTSSVAPRDADSSRDRLSDVSDCFLTSKGKG